MTEPLTQDQINVIVARAAETVRHLASDPVYVFELPSTPAQGAVVNNSTNGAASVPWSMCPVGDRTPFGGIR